MTQYADIQQYPIEKIIEIFRSQALSIPTPATSSRYLRALDSFSAFSSSASRFTDNVDNADNEENTLQLRCADWLVTLWLMKTPFATASLYLDIISSLYGSAAKAGLLPPTKIFSQLKASLRALGPDSWKSGINDEIFARALRLTKNASCLIADDAIAAQLVIYSLTHNLLPLSEVARLKKPSSIASSRYLFPLRQSSRTPKQLSAHIAKIVNALFRRARLPQATDPFETVESLWAYAALRSGIPASCLLRHLGHVPLGIPVLKLSAISRQLSDSSDRSDLSDRSEKILRAPLADTSKEDFSQVGKIFLENPPRWYAMSLRPGVRFTQVCRRIELLGDLIPDIRLFYPCEEIARAVGKKIVTRQRPFIPSVVFFRAKLTDIGRLFSKIGDLAWCYRQSASPGATYANISQQQFELFQRTIARFTPDYEVAPIGELELHEGDHVEILGGLFTGMEATVEAPLPACPMPTTYNSTGALGLSSEAPQNADASGVVYRLNIIGDNGIDWRINVEPRLLKKH